MRGVGTLIGTLWFRVILGDSQGRMRATLVGAFAAQILIYWLLSESVEYWQAGLAYAASGLSQGVVWVFAGTLLREVTDDRYHGRVFAMEFGSMTLTLAASSLIAGYLVDLGLGAPQVVAYLAPLPIFGVLASLYVWWSQR